MYKYNFNLCIFVLEVIYNFGNEKKYIFKIKNYFVKIFCRDLNRLVCCEVYILIVVGIL